MAAERGVRVYTIGVGTVGGEIITGDGWAFHSVLDEEALKEIANTTRGEYFYAGTAKDLSRIYRSLNSKIALERKETETTALFAAGAACLAVLSALLSLLWFNRLV
jgi:Ca-activated chloride channel family protein